MSIGKLIDDLYYLRTKRLEKEKEIEEFKEQEVSIKNEIIAYLNESNLAGIKGEVATAALTRKIKPNVTDWTLVYDYIFQHNCFELLQKRLSSTMWSEIMAEGLEVPGVEPIVIVDLSLTKSKR